MEIRHQKKLGNWGEQVATKFLRECGMEVVEHNYCVRGGEIDLIAKDGNYWVFVEVKTRTSTSFGSGLEAINHHKRRALLYAAQAYAAEKGISDQPMRVDVVEIFLRPGDDPEVRYIKNALEQE